MWPIISNTTLRRAAAQAAVLFEKQRIPDAGLAGALAALDHGNVLRLVGIQDGHAADRAAPVAAGDRGRPGTSGRAFRPDTVSDQLLSATRISSSIFLASPNSMRLFSL